MFRDLGCEKAPLGVPGREPKDRGGLSREEPVAWIGIQEVGGAAHAPARRAQDAETARTIYAMVEAYERSAATIGARVFRRCLEVASGERVRAEETGQRELQVWGERAVAL